MKTLLLLSLLAPLSAFADSAPECIPAEAVVCTINSYCDSQTTAYYALSTSVQTINRISVDAGVAGSCQVSSTLAPAALAKLEAEAQQLKDAGVCKVIINTI